MMDGDLLTVRGGRRDHPGLAAPESFGTPTLPDTRAWDQEGPRGDMFGEDGLVISNSGGSLMYTTHPGVWLEKGGIETVST